MKKSSSLFLRIVLGFIAGVVLFICIFGIPRVIGDFSIGGYDRILIGLYVTAVPFFFALYEANRLLTNIDREQAFSKSSVLSLRNIKYSAILIASLFVLAMPYIFYVADKDDAPGVVAIAFVITFASIVIATFSAVLQRLVQSAVDIKRENDLTV